MSLWDEFVRTARAHAGAPALSAGSVLLCYGETLAAVQEFGGRLTEAGLRPGRTAAVQSAMSVEGVVSALAVMRAGATLLPLDASLKSLEVERACRQSGACLFIAEHPEAVACLTDCTALSLPTADEVAVWARVRPAEDGGGSAGDFLFLSSGTTGLPKIVVRAHAQMEAAVRIRRSVHPYGPTDRVLGIMPMAHTSGFAHVMLAALLSGASLRAEPFSPRAAATAIERDGITVLRAAPFMFALMAQTEFRTRPDFGSVRLAVAAGSALTPAVGHAFRQAFGVGIWQSYGATEAGPVTMAQPDVGMGRAGSVGQPCPEVTVEVWDEHGQPLPPEGEGEVVVRSPAVASGYLNLPVETLRAFRNGAFLTGDLGRLEADGSLTLTGRRKPMIDVAGKKVSPAEVEACLRSHPRVADVAVGSVVGTAGERVKAWVVPLGELTARELREFCVARLADHKVPREIEFVPTLAAGPMGKPKVPRPEGRTPDGG